MKKSFFLLLFIYSFGFGAYSQNTFDQGITDIANQVKPVVTKDGKIDQKLTKVSGSILELGVINTDAKGKSSTETHRFNLADINQSGLKQGMVGQNMVVEIPIQGNNKYIENNKNGKVSYDNSLKITVNDIDNSRSLITAIQALIPQAQKMELEKYSFSSQDEILTNLFKAIGPIGEATQQIKSTADKKEKLDFTFTKDSKKKTYEFNLSDINPSTINVSIEGFMGGFIGGSSLSVSFDATGNQQLIKQFENDVPKSYVSKFSVYPKDIENAKQIKNLFILAIQNIKAGVTSLPNSSSSQAAPTTSTSNDKSANANPSNPHLIASKIVTNAPNKMYAEPEFVGQAAFINQDTGTTALEKQIPHFTTKANGAAMAFGAGKVTQRIVVPGANSPVRVRAKSPLSIIVNAGTNTKDPFATIQIFKLTTKSDRREAEIASVGTFSGAQKGDMLYVKFQGKKFGDTSYLLTIQDDEITPGEYGIAIDGVKEMVNLFGADN